MIIRIDYPQPSVRLDLWGGTSGTFDGIDRFGRTVDQHWQNNTNTTPVDIDRYKYGYDQDSNRLWKQNTVGSGFDESYTYDALNRLTQMQRGTLNSAHTAITGTPAKQQNWTLDPLGNWNDFSTQTSGATDLSQTRTHDKDNQITGFSSTPAWATPPGYDAAGNMTSFPKPDSPANTFTTTYDAWNRMATVSDSSGTVATYQYDGKGRRTVKATSTETRRFYFTSSWQDIEERTGTSTSADLQYVWGIRYVDELICRDDSSSNRLFACQDANFNLTCIIDSSGVVQERYLFEPYGPRAINDPTGTSRPSSSFGWVIGHQGLLIDLDILQTYNRLRWVGNLIGRFLRFDPLGYYDSDNLFEYLRSSPVNHLDAEGAGAWCSCSAPPPVAGFLTAPPCLSTTVGKVWGVASAGTCSPKAQPWWLNEFCYPSVVAYQFLRCGGPCTWAQRFICTATTGVPSPVYRWIPVGVPTITACP